VPATLPARWCKITPRREPPHRARDWQNRPVPRSLIVFAVATCALATCTVVACTGGSDRSVKSFCHELTTAQSVFGNGRHDGPTIAEEFRRVGSHAPDEIRASWDELAGLFGELAKVDTSDEQSVQAGYQRAQAPSVQQAATAITSYAKATCGFDLAMPPVTVQTPTSATTP
jgi:hypothetical protein